MWVFCRVGLDSMRHVCYKILRFLLLPQDSHAKCEVWMISHSPGHEVLSTVIFVEVWLGREICEGIIRWTIYILNVSLKSSVPMHMVADRLTQESSVAADLRPEEAV